MKATTIDDDDNSSSWANYAAAGAVLQDIRERRATATAIEWTSYAYEGGLANTVTAIPERFADALVCSFRDFRRMMLALNLDVLQHLPSEKVSVRPRPAEIGSAVLRRFEEISGRTPVLYPTPDGGLVIDFVLQEQRLSIVIEDEFCIFTLTKNGETSQRTLNLSDDALIPQAEACLRRILN